MDYLPRFKPGDALPVTASAAIIGGRLVEVTGPYAVGPAGAASVKVLGHAAQDTAAGATVSVFTVGNVQRGTAEGTIAAGDSVGPAADGTLATIAEGPRLGIALTNAADGGTVDYLQGV